MAEPPEYKANKRVGLDGLDAQVQALGDLRSLHALANQAEDLQLAAKAASGQRMTSFGLPPTARCNIFSASRHRDAGQSAVLLRILHGGKNKDGLPVRV